MAIRLLMVTLFAVLAAVVHCHVRVRSWFTVVSIEAVPSPPKKVESSELLVVPLVPTNMEHCII